MSQVKHSSLSFCHQRLAGRWPGFYAVQWGDLSISGPTNFPGGMGMETCRARLRGSISEQVSLSSRCERFSIPVWFKQLLIKYSNEFKLRHTQHKSEKQENTLPPQLTMMNVISVNKCRRQKVQLQKTRFPTVQPLRIQNRNTEV